MKNVTLKEIASQLGVSVSTVSRALTDSYEINVETKKKVQKLAKDLNYQPNPFAAFLRKHKSNTIALVIPEISNNFFSLVIKGVEAACQENDYYVLIYESHEDFQKEQRIANHLMGGRVDGVLISVCSETRTSDHLKEVLERKIKMVMFDRVLNDIDVSKVTSNDYGNSLEATKLLLSQGCRKIMFLRAGLHLTTMDNREKAYRDALKSYGLNIDDSLVKTFPPSKELDLEELKAYLIDKKPDAVFCSVEHLAIACYDICKELNLKIPNDIKVITFSNLKVARLLNPSLSTISQPAYEIGKTAATLLINEIKGKHQEEGFQNIRLDSKLIKRDSTKKML
ncbi:LacI family DNA-binding transcriptional regulator [Pedobacter sp. SD-b]|uniref:LacI family DNA-binding transcriptional regulator n=1 Tax=Pedobacter segetis TaxID=2793069 RepID=A0ABS1BNJ0_9SPHI|nr:LacI family DNA-binding transcriptional regulator [Pedobacter segetis]MBK0384445.1 LacI family DNA-binding transcriptional regulator [Pedobacter segetis]